MDEVKKARLLESEAEIESESCVNLSELEHSCESESCVSCDFLNAVQILECVSMFFKNSQQDPRQFIGGLVCGPEDLVSLLGTFGEAQMLLGALINAAAALLAGSEEEE